MRLMYFTDFGLRTLMCLAGQPEHTFTTREIARIFGISRHHLTKIVQKLAEGGFIDTKRGVGGGIQLARPASEIYLGSVVRRLEAEQPLVECFRADGGACVMSGNCRLKARLAHATEAFLADLNHITLEECAWRPSST